MPSNALLRGQQMSETSCEDYSQDILLVFRRGWYKIEDFGQEYFNVDDIVQIAFLLLE